jgi:hypothetical protein
MAVKKKLIDLLKDDLDSRKVELTVLGVAVTVTPLTLGEQMVINAKHPDDGALRFAEMLILKCRDAQGEPVFSKDDKSALKRAVAGDRLTPVINAITGPGIETQTKN